MIPTQFRNMGVKGAALVNVSYAARLLLSRLGKYVLRVVSKCHNYLLGGLDFVISLWRSLTFLSPHAECGIRLQNPLLLLRYILSLESSELLLHTAAAPWHSMSFHEFSVRVFHSLRQNKYFSYFMNEHSKKNAI